MIGYSFFRYRDSDWRSHQNTHLPLAPPHVATGLSTWQARKMLLLRPALFVRWEEGFDCGCAGEWWHVVTESLDPLPDLKPKVRTKLRKGLRDFDVGRASREEILQEGYDVYRAAFDRYDTFEPVYSKQRFRKAVTGLPPETEFWAIRKKGSGELVGFSENLVRDHACVYVTTWFRPEFLRAAGGYSGYALFYAMTRHYLGERGLRYVSDGARTISHRTQVHQFLQDNFGFRRAYSQLRVVYFPGVGLLVRFLYPFRHLFEKRATGLARKVFVVLEQERIRRSCLDARSGTE